MNIHNNPDAFFQEKVNCKEDLMIPVSISLAAGIIGALPATLPGQLNCRVTQAQKISPPDTILSVGVPGIEIVIYLIFKPGVNS